MIHKLCKGLAPAAALALGMLAAGCDGRMNVQLGDSEGVPLADLDTAGAAPEKLVFAGPDRVVISDGAALDIEVSGDPEAVDSLRFMLEDGTLGIARERNGGPDDARALIRVTMPSPRSITLAGSGDLEAASLSGSAEVTVAGSGNARVARVAADTLNTTIAGSGRFDAAGAADALDLTIAGSGSARMAGLRAERANVTIAGSGDAAFASNGTVDASIMGSGTVDVIGRARCTISAMGSGSLNCRDGSTSARSDRDAAPRPPAPPPAPAAPQAGE